jgi:hypothetical protein
MLHDVEFSILDQISTKQNRHDSSSKKYGGGSSSGMHHSAQKNKKNLASLNRSAAGGASSAVKGNAYENSSQAYHSTTHGAAEDETESYQVQFGGDYSLSAKKQKGKQAGLPQQPLQSFGQHGMALESSSNP